MEKHEFVYHGTSELAARRAIESGLRPRGDRSGNWKHSASSNPDMVYLTAAYAPYFALAAVDAGKRAAIIEIDLNALDQNLLYPDEDFIEQGLRAKPLGKSDNINARNRYVIKHIEEYQENWRLSLDHLGNVCHKGTIPPAAITRIVAFDYRKNGFLASQMLEPTITIANYKFCGEKYRALTRYFMGDEIDASILATDGFPIEAMRQVPWIAAAILQCEKRLSRAGLEQVFQRS
jgi:hypothetical protein